MRRTLTTLAAVLTFATLGGCGEGDDAPAASTTTEPATTTSSIEQGDAKGIACAFLSTRELKLRNDYRDEARGILPPDDEAYRQEANELRAEHIRLGCPGVPLRGFLE